jgi:formylglycine-generating enzyme required for sulfatase activity
MAPDLIPELARVPAGQFLMGSDEGDDDERPVHRVDVGAFDIAVQPVTNREYARFVRDTGHRAPAIYELPLVVSAGGAERERVFRETGGPYVWTDFVPPEDRADHPVTLVRYEDAAAYCTWLSSVTDRPFRLPTEAEWEKAARGGAESKWYPWGDRLEPACANYLQDPGQKRSAGTMPCRQFPANGYGLFDMSGNVWEWVQDWYDPAYYPFSPKQNPPGPSNGTLRIVRGGGWLVSDARLLSCSHRHRVPPDTYSYSIGFRVLCQV